MGGVRGCVCVCVCLKTELQYSIIRILHLYNIGGMTNPMTTWSHLAESFGLGHEYKILTLLLTVFVILGKSFNLNPCYYLLNRDNTFQSFMDSIK